MKRYGMTPVEYTEWLSRQGGVCAICGSADPRSGGRGTTKSSNFAVDHDHATGKVRGLLCVNCNMMLGQSFDNPEILRAGARYLEENK